MIYSLLGGFDFSKSRDDWIRTSDPHVPNVVRYQLRYIPVFNGGKNNIFIRNESNHPKIILIIF